VQKLMAQKKMEIKKAGTQGVTKRDREEPQKKSRPSLKGRLFFELAAAARASRMARPELMAPDLAQPFIL
jgi:hypothetical protein